jgi:hypothetical protein
MAQDWGPAEPLRRIAARISALSDRAGGADRTVGRGGGGGKRNTSWHDRKVREANESYRQAAKRKSASRSSARKSTSRSSSRSAGR